jgi:hypothetical protein
VVAGTGRFFLLVDVGLEPSGHAGYTIRGRERVKVEVVWMEVGWRSIW